MLRYALYLVMSIVSIAGARAQQPQPAWPTKQVKIIVPVAAGTATDLTARIFGDKLAQRFGQPVVVENRPGADGLVAVGGFVTGRDDHTLLFSFSTAVSLNPLIHQKLPYDPGVDLVPVTTTTEVIFGIAAHGSVGASTLKELVAQAKANPGKFNWVAAPGLPRFVFEGFRRATGMDLVYVPYNQTGNAVQDLGEGRVQVMIASVGALLPVVQAGKAKILAVTSQDRAGIVPDVQSAMEAGHPELVIPALGCVFGWKDMPNAVRDRLAADVDAVAQDKDVIERLAKIGQTVRRSNPQALAELLVAQRKQLAPIAAAIAPAK